MNTAPLAGSLPADQRPRMATIAKICELLVPLYFDPPLSRVALARMLNRARVPRTKSGAFGKRGGGKVYYNLDAAERVMRQKARLLA